MDESPPALRVDPRVEEDALNSKMQLSGFRRLGWLDAPLRVAAMLESVDAHALAKIAFAALLCSRVCERKPEASVNSK